MAIAAIPTTVVSYISQHAGRRFHGAAEELFCDGRQQFQQFGQPRLGPRARRKTSSAGGCSFITRSRRTGVRSTDASSLPRVRLIGYADVAAGRMDRSLCRRVNLLVGSSAVGYAVMMRHQPGCADCLRDGLRLRAADGTKPVWPASGRLSLPAPTREFSVLPCVCVLHAVQLGCAADGVGPEHAVIVAWNGWQPPPWREVLHRQLACRRRGRGGDLQLPRHHVSALGVVRRCFSS